MTQPVFSVIAGLIALGCVVQAAWNPKPLMIWNVTASAPIGLYRRSFAPVSEGAWVLVDPPPHAANLAAERAYLPTNVPMVKRIAALRGDTVCRIALTVTVNGTVRAIALDRDAKGRALPAWQGCKHLTSDEMFLLTSPSTSFDSRYFGPVARANLIERIEPLWTF